MFNLNKDNRIVIAQHPTDMRMGVNGMCGQVRKVCLKPANGILPEGLSDESLSLYVR